MPDPTRQLHRGDVERHVEGAVFAPERPARLGLELEWITRGPGGGRPAIETLEEVVASTGHQLTGGSRLSIEPGGQLELSSRAFAEPTDTTEAVITDLYRLERACRARGVDLVAIGHDPVRPPESLRGAVPRYGAMATYFAPWPSGAQMMTNTAALQINVGLGEDDDAVRRRWRLSHALGPVLVAAFANSPLVGGRPSGWRSARWRCWERLDPTRTRGVDLDGDPAGSWVRYLLDAPVMCIRVADDDFRTLREPLPFGRWLDEGHELGWPTFDDLAYHLTTLFPPVRPRGWLELRYLDVLPTPLWLVATAVVVTCLDDPDLGAELDAVLVPTRGGWAEAARGGLDHPALARAADRVFTMALDALEHAAGDQPLTDLVGRYLDHWVRRGRTPADDQLEGWRATGAAFSEPRWPLPQPLLAGELP